MEQYQPHNSIDPSLPHPHPPFFTTTTAAAEPPPTTFTPQPPPLNQTSYDEMILAAISGLGEKDGSSRQAIARYIERVYSNLPSNHSILLTNHLKNLKNSGQLILVKRSYLIPSGSAPSPAYSVHPPPAAAAPPLYTASTAAPPFSAAVSDGSAAGATPQLKKRGRPPKAKVDVAQAYEAQNVAAGGLSGLDQAQYQNYVGGPNRSVQNVSDGPNLNVETGPGSFKRRPGRPRKDKTNQAQTQSQAQDQDQAQDQAQYSFPTGLGEAQNISFPPGDAPTEDNDGGYGGATLKAVQGNGIVSESEAMLVSLGLSDGPVPTKMRPRRAPKPTMAAQPQTEESTGRKKRPGRPRKVAPPAPGVWPVQVPVGAVVAGSASGRSRGRPRKNQPAVVPYNGGVSGVQVQHKKRGRKPKSTTQDAGFSVPVSFMMPEQMNGGGGVMMPEAPYTQAGGAAAVAAAAGGFVQGNAQVPVSDGYNGVVHSVPGKRGRGRPPGIYGSYGQRKGSKLSGKPLGRPRKISAGSEDQSFDIVNLKNKIDYLQSKISEALPVIKSCINNEEPNVMGALGQLEELVKMDFTAPAAPVNLQNQQQPHAQQLQAEHQ